MRRSESRLRCKSLYNLTPRKPTNVLVKPCQRLNKVCDRGHRWEWRDATDTTRTKFPNVIAKSSVSWDSKCSCSPFARLTTLFPILINTEDTKPVQWAVRQSPYQAIPDNLPDFVELTTDEERQKKAETVPAGTYTVVVNSESFANSAAYSQDRSRHGADDDDASPATPASRESSHVRINGVSGSILLTRIDDVVNLADYSIVPSMQGSRAPSPSRQQQYPYVEFDQLNSATQVLDSSTLSPLAEVPIYSDNQLLDFFTRVVYPRIFPFNVDSSSRPFLSEVSRFEPLRHAICATSLICLSFRQRPQQQQPAFQEKALYRNAQAYESLQQYITVEQDVVADGVFYMHFVLLIFDMCIPSANGDSMWSRHITQLARFVSVQTQVLAVRPILAFSVWLDIQACLAGRVAAGALLELDVFDDERFLTSMAPSQISAIDIARQFAAHGVQALQRLALLVSSMRQEAREEKDLMDSASRSIGVDRRIRQATQIADYYKELEQRWGRAQPSALLGRGPILNTQVDRAVRYAFNCGFISFTCCALYAHVMAPSSTTHSTILGRCGHLLALAEFEAQHTSFEHPTIGFAIFMAGLASRRSDVARTAIDLLGRMQGLTIGNGPFRARQLLIAVRDERNRYAQLGLSPEEVDWIVVAEQNKLEMVDFGL